MSDVNITNGRIGVISKEIAEATDSAVETLNNEDVANFLEHARKDKTVLWGVVQGIKEKLYDREGNVMFPDTPFFVKVRFDTAIVYISEHDFFDPTYRFGSAYMQLQDEEKKIEHRKRRAASMAEAQVCFLLNKVMVTDYNGFKDVSCLANRVKALNILKETYFFHTNSSMPTNREVKVNDEVYARILEVQEDRVLVEAFGVETRLNRNTISSGRGSVSTCKDVVKAGGVVKLRVKDLEIDVDRRSAKLVLSNKKPEVTTTANVEIGESFCGLIQKVNNAKKCYSAIAYPEGIVCRINFRDVAGKSIYLRRGDRVFMVVTKVYEEFVCCNAKKIA